MVDELARAGFKPTIIAATTSSFGGDLFAAAFERTPDPIPLTRHDLVSGDPNDPNTIEYWTEQARLNRWRPTTLTVYGTAPDQARFAGVWEPNPQVVAWNTDGLTETFEDHQRRFEAQFTAWNRPAYVTVSPSVRYLSLFQDDQIGDWIARHGMVRQDYERQRAEFIGQGDGREVTVEHGPEPRRVVQRGPEVVGVRACVQLGSSRQHLVRCRSSGSRRA